jgi:hypothetical protein
MIGNFVREPDAPNSILVMELKNMSLRYLWKARQPNRESEPASQNDYKPLLTEVGRVSEDQLLDMLYSFPTKAEIMSLSESGTLCRPLLLSSTVI